MSDAKISDEHIAQLQEMGFSIEEASNALRISNDDISEAVSHLFSDNVPPPPPARPDSNKQLIKIEEHVTDTIINDQKPFGPDTQDHFAAVDSGPPNFESIAESNSLNTYGPKNQNQLQSNYTHPPYNIGDHNEASINSNQEGAPPFYSEGSSQGSSAYSLNDYKNYATVTHMDSAEGSMKNRSVYDDPKKYKREEGLPVILLPQSPGYLESYYAPLLMVLHEVPSFRNLFFETEFPNYGFYPSWWKTSDINIPNMNNNNSRYILEIQRYLAFLDGNSHRSFASIKNLVSSLPNPMRARLRDIDTVDELIPYIYDSFHKGLSLLHKKDVVAIDKLFSLCFRDSEGRTKEIRSIHITQSYFRPTLFRTVSEMLFGTNFNTLGKIMLTDIGDILTLTLSASGDGDKPDEVEIPEYFYPELFSENFLEFFKERSQAKLKIQSKKRELARESMAITSHHGKPIVPLLNDSMLYLNSLIETNENNGSDSVELQLAVKNMLEVKEKMSEKKQRLATEQGLLAKEEEVIDLHDVYDILDSIPEDTKPDPFRLIGAIISDREFFYLLRSKDLLEPEHLWVHCVYESEHANYFHIKQVEFDYVQSMLEEVTSALYEDSMVLIYCKKESWESNDFKPIPPNLMRFLNKDHEEVVKSQDLLDESDILDDEEENDGKEEISAEKGSEKDNDYDDEDDDDMELSVEFKNNATPSDEDDTIEAKLST